MVSQSLMVSDFDLSLMMRKDRQIGNNSFGFCKESVEKKINRRVSRILFVFSLALPHLLHSQQTT